MLTILNHADKTASLTVLSASLPNHESAILTINMKIINQQSLTNIFLIILVFINQQSFLTIIFHLNLDQSTNYYPIKKKAPPISKVSFPGWAFLTALRRTASEPKMGSSLDLTAATCGRRPPGVVQCHGDPQPPLLNGGYDHQNCLKT